MGSEAANEIRRQKGLQIAQTCRISKKPTGEYLVPSQSGMGKYTVRYVGYKPQCDCPDFEKRNVLGVRCKHIWAVQLIVNRHLNQDGTVTTTKTMKMTYGQNWTSYTLAQTHEKELFMRLLNDLCQSVPNPQYKFGRPILPLSDMVFSSALKVYTTFSLRRFTSDMNGAKEKGYIDAVPYYTTVARYMEKPELTPVLIDLIMKTALPLASVETDFAVDSSGFSTRRYARWFDFKYGKEKDVRIWLKAHLMCGTKTNIVTAVEVTEGYGADSPRLPELVNATKLHFDIKQVSADKAYSSVNNLEIIERAGGEPFIPFKSNTVTRARQPRIWKRLYHYFQFNREDFLQNYHKRSNVETTFHMIKAKFGTQIRSKTKTAEINEVLCKILCHNICVVIQEMHELGIEPTFAVAKVGVV
ncbi:MAG: transposase [Candidatus Aenigmarchaeota archaeon]|nr:transposase [Candidatus Aenigmarchaeota archaeon]